MTIAITEIRIAGGIKYDSYGSCEQANLKCTEIASTLIQTKKIYIDYKLGWMVLLLWLYSFTLKSVMCLLFYCSFHFTENPIFLKFYGILKLS